MAVGDRPIPIISQRAAVEKSSEHETDPPQDGGDADDKREDEERPEGEKTMIEKEDGKLGGGDGAAEQDLGGLVGLVEIVRCVSKQAEGDLITLMKEVIWSRVSVTICLPTPDLIAARKLQHLRCENPLGNRVP